LVFFEYSLIDFKEQSDEELKNEYLKQTTVNLKTVDTHVFFSICEKIKFEFSEEFIGLYIDIIEDIES
jgi:uncharacterized protein (UPF0303 family)